MKKLLVVSDTFFPNVDGVTRFIKEVIPPLSEDFRISLLVPAYSSARSFRRMPLFKAPLLRFAKISAGQSYYLSMPNLFTVSRLVKESDIVFVQSLPFLGVCTIVMAHIHHKPVVMYFHQYIWEQFHHISRAPEWFRQRARRLARNISRYFCNRCDVLLVPSQQVMDTLEGLGFIAPKEIVQLGVNPSEFKPVADNARYKRRVGISAKQFVIGYCGRLSAEKDLPTLVAAFKELCLRHNNLVLLLVGGGGDISREIEGLPNVKVTGFVDKVVPYYRAMDVFVLPSLTETTGLSLLEAMSCGVPIVTTPVGFALTGIINGYNGLVFNQRDVAALVTYIEGLIKDATLRSNLGESARESILKGFTWAKTTERIKDILMRFV